MSSLEPILARMHVRATIFHNGHYCGGWAVDISGTKKMTFHVVTHGQCYLQTKDITIQLTKGDAVFFPNDAKHKLLPNLDEKTTANSIDSCSMQEPMEPDSVALVCGYFESQTPFFNSLSIYFPDAIILHHHESKDSGTLINLLIAEAKRADQNNNALLDRFADCLFYLLLRDHAPKEEGLFAALSHPKLAKTMHLIHTSSAKPITLESMAQEAGMSRSAFASLFKETLGQSPKEYVTQWRMTQAYEWLSKDGISTFEAAINCGYENEASFAKAFKRVIGIGPGAVRMKLSNETD